MWWNVGPGRRGRVTVVCVLGVVCVAQASEGGLVHICWTELGPAGARDLFNNTQAHAGRPRRQAPRVGCFARACSLAPIIIIIIIIILILKLVY